MEDCELSHTAPPEVNEKCAMIQDMVGCGYVEAWKALHANNQDVVLAIDALLAKPVVSGEKHIPPPPKVDSGMTPEQEARCKKGRWLQDQVNAVFSVAHSKTRTPLDAGGYSSGEAHPVSTTQPASADAAVQPS